MNSYRIKKGHNLKVSGTPELKIYNVPEPQVVTLHPSRLKSFKTKLLIKINDDVKVGMPLFFDKNNSDVMFVSPVSGKISDIIYGKRRIIESVIINNDNNYSTVLVDNDISKDTLLVSGLWSLIRQKPFSKIPHSQSLPKSFFISTIPTIPFAIDYSFLFQNIDNCIQDGIDVLKKIFNCDINIAISKNSIFSNLKNVHFHTFNKLHPSGNVGVQIHHIDPIKNANDTRWYLSLQDLNRIGLYFKNKDNLHYKYISVGGNGFEKPAYYKTLQGTPINKMIKCSKSDDVRYISGDVLSGNEISNNLSMDYYDEILSSIKIDNKREFLGWLMPGLKKYSLSNAFLSKVISNNKSVLSTKLHGSIRTIIPMGNWDKVLPMNIYSEYLVKSIIAKDIDMMEKLGIYEASPEDFSLCSFVCQSKVEVSSIIEEGLDLMESEL